MDVADEKIRREVLTTLYEGFEQGPMTRVGDETIADQLPDVSEADVDYMLRRIEDEYANVDHFNTGMSAQITASGIEWLADRGVETILGTDLRYRVLETLYDFDRQNRGRGYVGTEDLCDELGAEPADLNKHLWYLKEKRLIESQRGLGKLFHGIQITEYGRSKYEAYRDSGVEIPSTGPASFGKQASINPGEQQQAENLFRDIVELARDEVIIIDRYARTPLYDLLNHVPDGVQIRVLTSNRVTGSDYADTVNEFEQKHPEIDVREVSDGWDFHDRYVFRDEDTAWSWGHSFHDAGDTQHTASELTPVNRSRTREKFEETWERGTEVN